MIVIPLITPVAFDEAHNPGFIFDGVHSNDYGISIRKKNLSLLPTERNYLTQTIGKHGAYDFGLDYDMRMIEFECWVNEKNFTLLQEKRREIADWLDPLEGCKDLIFDYDNKIYSARIQDTGNVTELLGSGRFNLTFLCPSPFARNKYAHKVYFVDSVATINRNGSAPTPHIISLTFTDSTSYITLTHSSGKLLKVTNSSHQSTKTLTKQPDATDGIDTMAVQAAPDTNYETDVRLFVNNKASVFWSYLDFDISTIPAGSTIVSATLSLWVYGNTDAIIGDTLNFKRITASWDEATLTYNNAPAVSANLDTDIIATITANAEDQFDVKDTIQACLDNTDYGFRIDITEAHEIRYHSSDSTTAAYRPKLVVTYVPPGFTEADTLEIDTENRTVKINDVNAIDELDIESDFFELNKGTETITDSTANKISGHTTFFERWL